MASGTISFGLVAIPVKLYTTSESANAVSFSMVHKTCGTRVKYRYYCPTDDELVEREDICKGYEFANGQFVLFTDEELKALNPEPTNAIEIESFLPLEQVDPIFFEKAYYLGPDTGGAKPYRLLSATLAEAKQAALAMYAARGKNYLVLLRPFEGGLLMQQLRHLEDMKAFSEVPIDDAEVTDAELELARQLVAQTATDKFEPQKYRDEVKLQVRELIERKIQGEDIVAMPQEAPKAQIIDLMDALKASLGEGAEGRERKPAKASQRKAASRKRTKTARAASK